MQTFRSILFTIFLFLSVLPYALAAILARPFGRTASFRVAVSWAHLVLKTCKLLCGLDLTIEGQEHLGDEPCVVFVKHSSAYETIAQFLFVPHQSWVLKRELMWAPFFGWGLACLHPIAINRSAGRSAVEQVIRQGKHRLSEGLWVLIYPEGTRMKNGETRRYGVSGTLLAQAANVSIVPIAHNAGKFWPRRGWRKRPGTIRFVMGPPIDPAGREPREVNDEIQSWVENKVAELDV